MTINLYRTINMKNKIKTILICGLLAVGQEVFTASVPDSGVLEEVLAETTSSSFKRYYSLWASDSDASAEEARVFFRTHVNNPKPKYAKGACSILINGNKEDKNFILPHVRAMQASSNAKVATWATSLLLIFGTPDDGAIAIDRLKELVQSKDVTVSSLAVYELFIRHEVDFDAALTISEEAIKSDDDHIKLAGAKVLTYMAKVIGSELSIDDVLMLLRKLVKGTKSEIRGVAAEIFAESSNTLEDHELILPVIQSMAEDPRGPEAGAAAWHLNSGPFSDKKKAIDIARIRSANPRLRSSRDALILMLGSPDQGDQALVNDALRTLLDDSNHHNSFLSAAYFLDYGDEKEKLFAIAAFERIIKDLNFPFNNDVVGFLISSDLEGVYDMVVNHVKTVLIEERGSKFLRAKYTEYFSVRDDDSEDQEKPPLGDGAL